MCPLIHHPHSAAVEITVPSSFSPSAPCVCPLRPPPRVEPAPPSGAASGAAANGTSAYHHALKPHPGTPPAPEEQPSARARPPAPRRPPSCACHAFGKLPAALQGASGTPKLPRPLLGPFPLLLPPCPAPRLPLGLADVAQDLECGSASLPRPTHNPKPLGGRCPALAGTRDPRTVSSSR